MLLTAALGHVSLGALLWEMHFAHLVGWTFNGYEMDPTWLLSVWTWKRRVETIYLLNGIVRLIVGDLDVQLYFQGLGQLARLPEAGPSALHIHRKALFMVGGTTGRIKGRVVQTPPPWPLLKRHRLGSLLASRKIMVTTELSLRESWA